MVAGWGTAAAGPHSAGPPAGPPAHWSEISQEKEEAYFRNLQVNYLNAMADDLWKCPVSIAFKDLKSN